MARKTDEPGTAFHSLWKSLYLTQIDLADVLIEYCCFIQNDLDMASLENDFLFVPFSDRKESPALCRSQAVNRTMKLVRL